MPSPPIQLFLTTIASQPVLRQRQELLLRTLQVKKIPYISYDLASDEEAKRLWKRRAPADNQQLPGILVGGKFPGPFSEFEDAIECDDLATFLRLDEAYDPSVEEERPLLREQTIGVPGVSPSPSPLKPKVNTSAIAKSPALGSSRKLFPDTPTLVGTQPPPPTPVSKQDDPEVGDDLSGYGLQGVRVTNDELSKLMEELGLGGDDADDLVKSLTGGEAKTPTGDKTPVTEVTQKD